MFEKYTILNIKILIISILWIKYFLYPIDFKWCELASNRIKNWSTYVDNSKTFESLNAKKRQFRLRSAQEFVILLLKMCFVFGQKKVVVIDPGHGGIDSGAIGVNGIYNQYRWSELLFEAKKHQGYGIGYFWWKFLIIQMRGCERFSRLSQGISPKNCISSFHINKNTVSV